MRGGHHQLLRPSDIDSILQQAVVASDSAQVDMLRRIVGSTVRHQLRSCSSASATAPLSFIHRAAATRDANSLLGKFQSAGPIFDACLQEAGLDVIKIGPEGVECELVVTESLTNNFGYAFTPCSLPCISACRSVSPCASRRASRTATSLRDSTLHGGATATLVDVVGTLALLGRDPTRPGISVEMCVPRRAAFARARATSCPFPFGAHRNQSFCAAAKKGERLHIVGTVLRYGRTLGFTEVAIRGWPQGAEEGRLYAVGRHTKFFAEGAKPSAAGR